MTGLPGRWPQAPCSGRLASTWLAARVSAYRVRFDPLLRRRSSRSAKEFARLLDRPASLQMSQQPVAAPASLPSGRTVIGWRTARRRGAAAGGGVRRARGDIARRLRGRHRRKGRCPDGRQPRTECAAGRRSPGCPRSAGHCGSRVRSWKGLPCFWTRGDGRTDSVMLFGPDVSASVPPGMAFKASPEWTEVEIPLSRFPAATPGLIGDLAFVAQAPPPGRFAFELDDMEIR